MSHNIPQEEIPPVEIEPSADTPNSPHESLLHTPTVTSLPAALSPAHSIPPPTDPVEPTVAAISTPLEPAEEEVTSLTTTTPTDPPAIAPRSHPSAPLSRSLLPPRSEITPLASTSSSNSPEGKKYTAPSWYNPSRRPSTLGSSPRPKVPTPTLDKTLQDLRILLKSFLVFIPSSLRKLRFLLPAPLIRLARAIIRQMAIGLHKRGALASSMFYDLLVFCWTTMITIFFREIRSRGAWKIPLEGEGAVIFVVGPHHNQFLDPCLLTSEVRREAGRRISFLVAESSMHKRFIGMAAHLMQSIPVARPQDLAKPAKGLVTLSREDPTILIGIGTSFLTDFAPRKSIMLARTVGGTISEVVEVLDDNRIRIKKELGKKTSDGLLAKPEGLTFKVIPYVDQSAMYSSVYQKLAQGGCIGIFPEGGSHDRTDLLPLKAGVSIMALGALSANPSLRLRIVPVGLSYFHPHRFRSRAVVEFGSPIEIPKEFVQDFEKGGEDKRGAISGMMELVVDGLKSVTVRAPDYETLMLIQATRRLYRPPGQHLTLGQIVELNKRFIAGYEVYKDDPKLKALTAGVKEYNTLLRYMGLKDHQIERVARPLWRSIVLLCYRFGLFSAWGILALPGVVLNAPIFIAASYISHKKAREALAASTVKIKGNDVLATWKVLVALAGAPTLYSIYALGATYLAFRFEMERKYKIYAPIATMVGLPLIGYSALKFGEVGVDVYKSLRPLFLSVVPGNEKQLDKLRTMRATLQHDISVVVNEFGPQLFDDFKRTRIIPPTAAPPPVSPTLTRRRSTYGPQGQGTFLTHPMSWVDEYLFGWSAQPKQQASGHESDGQSEGGATRSGYVSGYASDEAPDYDEVIHILSREQEGTDTPQTAPSESGSRYRKSSRSRSRSQLDLTAVNVAVEKNSIEGKDASAYNSRKASGVLASSSGLAAKVELEKRGKKAEDGKE